MSQLIKRLDSAFSQFIRLSNADRMGKCTCATCNYRDHWKKMQCGHFIPRGNMATRWDEINCAPQCWKCNNELMGNPEEFEKYLLIRYGAEEVIELKKRGKSAMKFMKYELEAKLELYQFKVRELK